MLVAPEGVVNLIVWAPVPLVTIVNFSCMSHRFPIIRYQASWIVEEVIVPAVEVMVGVHVLQEPTSAKN